MIIIGPDGCVLDEAPPELNTRQPEYLLVDLRAVRDCEPAVVRGEPARWGLRA